MRHGIIAAVSALCVALSPAGADARVYIDEGEDFSMPPIFVPPTPPVSAEPARATPRALRTRLRAMDHEVAECVRTHLDETPRTLTVHVFVHPSGEWGIGFGRARTAEPGSRGETPVEVCIADWVASSVGSRAEPFRGRRARDVAVTFRLR